MLQSSQVLDLVMEWPWATMLVLQTELVLAWMSVPVLMLALWAPQCTRLLEELLLPPKQLESVYPYMPISSL